MVHKNQSRRRSTGVRGSFFREHSQRTYHKDGHTNPEGARNIKRHIMNSRIKQRCKHHGG